MFRLHGFFTQNSRKPLYVLAELGVEFEFVFVDLLAGEQRSGDFLELNPLGKVPVLDHDGRCLTESGAICRYVANVVESPLYPPEPMRRARVDQWLDYFAFHPGRWLTKLYFEQVIRKKGNLGDPDQRGIDEANELIVPHLKNLDVHLSKVDWLANNSLSIADISAVAYMEQHRDVGLTLDDYPNISNWFDRLDSRDSIARARALLPPGN